MCDALASVGTVAGPVQLHSLFENMPLYGSATELAGNTIVYLIIYCGSAACLQYVFSFVRRLPYMAVVVVVVHCLHTATVRNNQQ